MQADVSKTLQRTGFLLGHDSGSGCQTPVHSPASEAHPGAVFRAAIPSCYWSPRWLSKNIFPLCVFRSFAERGKMKQSMKKLS